MDTLVLDATTKSLTIQLDGAATSNTVTWVSAYADNNGSSFTEGASNGVINNATPITIVPAPASSTRRVIKSISVQNGDSSPQIITIKYVTSGGSTAIIGRTTLEPGDRWTLDGTYNLEGALKYGLNVVSSIPYTWSALHTFEAGISAAGGVTFNGVVSGSTAGFSRLVTFSGGISAAGGITFNGTFSGSTASFSRLATFNAGISAAGGITFGGLVSAPTRPVGTNDTTLATTAFVQSEIVADTVTSYNGRTGAVQGVSAAVPGDGISVSGTTGAVTFTNTGVTLAVAGTGISVSSGTGRVEITNIGASLGTNTFSGLQTFGAGICAAGGITFNGSVSGSTAAFSRLVTFGAGISASGGVTLGGSVYCESGVVVGAGAISAKTAGYTLAPSDNGKVITVDSSTTSVVGIDTATGAIGYSCTLIQLGTGIVRFAGSGVTLNSFNGLTFAGQHASASVVCYQTNVFHVAGNLEI
jgi:hypothetical protein